jgi:Ca-activated chloride channel family protein
MIKFAHPEYFIYLLLLPAIAAALWFAWFLKQRGIRAYGDQRSILALIDRHSRVKYWLRGGIMLLAIAVLVSAYANPLIGTKFEEVTRSGIDMIVAIDVSASMRAEDIQPNRISAARKELQNLINNLKGDRIGIIVFSGDAYTQLPLTSDYSAALMLTDVIDAGMAPTPGTAIGSAIELARESFRKEEGKYKAMVVITIPLPLRKRQPLKGLSFIQSVWVRLREPRFLLPPKADSRAIKRIMTDRSCSRGSMLKR